MIKISKGAALTADTIAIVLKEYYKDKRVIPGLPVLTYSDNNPEMSINMLNNSGKLSQLIYFGLTSEKAQTHNWHVLLDVGVAGLTTIGFTSKDELEQPALLTEAVQGTC